MPPPVLLAELSSIRTPDVSDIVRLARLFDVSKEAMVRAYVEHTIEAIAVVVVEQGKLARFYRRERHFPWISVKVGCPIPESSVLLGQSWYPGKKSDPRECDPSHWLAPSATSRIKLLTEQVLAQENGFALILLHATLHGDRERIG